MKLRIALLLLLTILCLTLTASASTFFSEGPIDGNDYAFFISGPNNPNPFGSFQDISNGFISALSGGGPNSLSFGEWVFNGSTPTSISYELGTSAFGTDLGSGTVALNSGNSVLLFTNGDGYDVYDITIPVASGPMIAGDLYWLSLSNATDSGGTNSGAWDIPNGGLGGPATCNFRQSGINLGDCGLGGESFTLSGACCGGTPEPSSIMLFGSGVLAVIGVLRRKLSR